MTLAVTFKDVIVPIGYFALVACVISLLVFLLVVIPLKRDDARRLERRRARRTNVRIGSQADPPRYGSHSVSRTPPDTDQDQPF